MSSERRKEQRELRVFREFVRRSGLLIDPDSIENRRPPEPDIFCRFHSGEGAAFELKELCEPSIAEMDDYLLKNAAEPQAQWVGDPTDRIVRKALKKQYETEHPIELLAYADGRIVMTPDAIMLGILDVCNSIHHRFRRVWFMGGSDEPCRCVYSVEDPLWNEGAFEVGVQWG